MTLTQAHTLPFDIWEHIASFLSVEETLMLISVNRALFNIAMNKRYRQVIISSTWHDDTSRNLTMLTDPDVAARVYHLQLELGPICYLSMEDQVVSLQSGKLNTKERIKKEAAVATLSTVMGHLNNLMSLRVEISCPYYEYFAKVNPPFFRIGWSCFCRTLQKLELRVPIESMDAILPDLTASGGKVENLEELSLDIMRATPSSTESTIIMLETIRPFLDVHRHSLKSLTIDALENTNLAPILDSVNFPSLAHFRLVQPYFQKWSADYTGVREFLTNHCSHLISFEIAVGFPAVDDGLYLSDSEPIFAQECFRVPLPNLQNLAVLYEFDDNPMTARIRDSVIDYVHQFRASLISLSLASRLTAKSAKRFVAGFRSGTLLQQLQISVDVLDTELFTALSKRSPLLQSLVLNYSDFAPNFFEETYMLDISHWKLRSLDISWRATYKLWKPKPAKSCVDKCQTALLQQLPHVMIFCGLRRKDYLISVALTLT